MELFSYSTTFSDQCYRIQCKLVILGQKILSVQPQPILLASSSPPLHVEDVLGSAVHSQPCVLRRTFLGPGIFSSHYSNLNCLSWATSNLVSCKDQTCVVSSMNWSRHKGHQHKNSNFINSVRGHIYWGRLFKKRRELTKF